MDFWTIYFCAAFILLALYGLAIGEFMRGWVRKEVIPPAAGKPVTHISVIIPARNESGVITECLECVAAQEYPHGLFEVLVVDDHSSDSTGEEVVKFIERTRQASPPASIKLLHNDSVQGKKAAIFHAIGAAKGELIVTTDADCRMGKRWLRTITAHYEPSRPAMLAGAVLIHAPSSFLENFQALEAAGLSALAGAAIAQGSPLLCSGANLAYRREDFLEAGGFTGIDKSASGDDVLLMEKIGARHSRGIRFIRSAEGWVWTRPQRSIRGFLLQRMRWVSKIARYMHPRARAFSLLVYLNNLILLLSLVFIFVSPFPLLSLLLAGMKFLIDFLFLLLATGHFCSRRLLRWLIPAGIFNAIYVSAAGFLGSVLSVRWKGR